MKYQIIYSSVSSTPMEPEDLDEILEHARSRNQRKGITGALVYVDRFFLQVLEGDRESLQQLMARIAADVRHETVTVLQEAEIASAAFSRWDMAYISATPAQMAEWAGLSATTRVPEVLTDMRQDPQRAMHMGKSILAVLAGKPAPQDTPE